MGGVSIFKLNLRGADLQHVILAGGSKVVEAELTNLIKTIAQSKYDRFVSGKPVKSKETIWAELSHRLFQRDGSIRQVTVYTVAGR